MFDYLYYKLYRATLTGSLHDIAQFMAPVYLAGLLSINIIVVNAFLAKVGVLPFLYKSDRQAGWIALILIIVASIYYGRKRHEKAINKYSNETNKQRIKGNMIVWVYVIVSFLLIFVVAFFRPGKFLACVV